MLAYLLLLPGFLFYFCQDMASVPWCTRKLLYQLRSNQQRSRDSVWTLLLVPCILVFHCFRCCFPVSTPLRFQNLLVSDSHLSQKQDFLVLCLYVLCLTHEHLPMPKPNMQWKTKSNHAETFWLLSDGILSHLLPSNPLLNTAYFNHGRRIEHWRWIQN